MTKNQLRYFSLFITTFFWSSYLIAQESVVSSGGNATSSNGSVAYSIGQVAYSSFKESAGTVDQGVQHAYEIYKVGINENAIDISLFAFPNPTFENLTIQVDDYQNNKLSYQLTDVLGKLINLGQINASQTIIDFNSLAAATYFVNIINQENQKIETFKIIKKK
jgi:hypothetical protein